MKIKKLEGCLVFGVLMLLILVFIFSLKLDSTKDIHKRHVPLGFVRNQTNVFKLWVADMKNGVSLRESRNQNSKILDNLPIGSFVVGFMDGNFVRTVFPISGWAFPHSSRITNLREVVFNVFNFSSILPLNMNFTLIRGDFTGGDLPGMPLQSSSIENCNFECYKRPLCHAFTRTADGNCWLKSERILKLKVSPSMTALSGKVHRTSSSATHCRNSVDNRSNDTLIIEITEIGASDSISRNPNIIRLRAKHGSWVEQVPIGTGEFGALVGGTINEEVIPLSVADFYFTSKSSDSGRSSIFLNFKESQTLFRKGELKRAAEQLNKIIQPGLGIFEYLLDVLLLFSSISFQDSVISETYLSSRNLDGTRISMLNDLKARLRCKGVHVKPVPDQDILISESKLDTENGIAYSYFHARNEFQQFAYQREWFASASDDIIATRITCFQFGQNLNETANCLHIVLQFNRFGGFPESEFPKPVIELEALSDKSDYLRHVGRKYAAGFQINFQMESNDNFIIPMVHMCGIVVCISGSTTTFDSNIILCDDAEALEMYFAVSIQQRPYNSTTKEKLKANCWGKMSVIAENSYHDLKHRHKKTFSHWMKQSYLELDSENDHGEDFIADKINNLGETCNGNEMSTLSLYAQSYNFGKYLYFSSASRSAINLQGIWADGPTSAWNGDYHLNINIQEAYWASGAIGGTVGFRPLLNLLSDLSKSGIETAADVYGCRRGGWVSHGFTDNRLRGGVLGDLQWSLCVTCGAWLTLQVWEMFLYKMTIAELEEFIPIMTGAALFFLEYMWEDENGVFQTGPTTSPENSFEICMPSDNNSLPLQPLPFLRGNSRSVSAKTLNIAFLTASPAIDMSIIRQLSSALSLSLSWAANSKSTLDWSLDRQIANDFIELVNRSANKALPKVSSKDGVILEYPEEIYINEIPNKPMNYPISEQVDSGHRHYSALHWVYPGLFHPKEGLQMLLDGSRRFMRNRRAGHSGHTSWSAAWEACLWARLQNSSAAFQSLTRILKKFSAPNLMSLHPALTPKGPNPCATCFEEGIQSRTRKSAAGIVASHARGLVSLEGDKIDGNLGFVAAMNELLVQSHVPNLILLLPSIPSELSATGYLTLFCRGDIKASLSWRNGNVTEATLLFNSNHPWHRGIEESPSGSGRFTLSQKLSRFSVFISSPNILYSNVSSCAHISATNIESVWVAGRPILEIVHGVVNSFPCEVLLHSQSQ